MCAATSSTGCEAEDPGKVELVLYFLFSSPGILALIISGWKYAERSWRYMEVSVNSPAGIPIFSSRP